MPESTALWAAHPKCINHRVH